MDESPINWKAEYMSLYQQGCFALRLLKDGKSDDAQELLENVLTTDPLPPTV